MNIHKNARLTPLRREEMALAVIEGRMIQAQAALVVTGRLLPRRFRLDASDEFFVVYKAVEEVVPFLR